MRNTAPPEATDQAPAAAGPLFMGWQAEAVRLREAHWGPLEDGLACRMARRAAPDLTTRIGVRAAWLAQQSGLHDRLRQWATGARWSLIGLWAMAGAAGAGAAATALGQPQGAINLSVALLALLGLHLLTLLIWLASCLPGIRAGSALSSLWLWLTHRLSKGPDAALAAQAFVSLLIRVRAWKSGVGLISHGAWTAAFCGMLPTLVILLSTRRYSFHWETTLLSPDSFVVLTEALSSGPRLLGFPPPGSHEVAASVSAQSLAAAIQADWSWWLIGCVVTWGLLPRALALLGCVLHLRRRLHGPLVDPGLPGWLELRERLMPLQETLGTDGPARNPPAAVPPGTKTGTAANGSAILAFELGADVPWPPENLPDGIRDLGHCDSREDRNRIRDQLTGAPPRLLLVCDARLTPDRGSRAWLDELRHLCAELQVLCREGEPSRLAGWQQMLSALAIPTVGSLPEWYAQAGTTDHD